MYIIPAIDLRNGKCVRLTKGEEGTEIIFSDNPVDVAKRWEAAGAKWIHVVDLDGAFQGKPLNLGVVEAIVGSVSCKVQVGGGIRNADVVDKYVKAGVERVIIGTAAFSDNGFLRAICARFPGKIAVGIDTKNGKIAVKGWKETLDLKYEDVISDLSDKGVSLIIHTNVDRDGTMEGINIEPVSGFITSSEIPVVVSGGIASMDDLAKLSSLRSENLYGVILGKSIYTGSIDLKMAIERYS